MFVAVLPGMTEREAPPEFIDAKVDSVKFREQTVIESTDQRRGLDYLATRPEIDTSRIAAFSLSAAANHLVYWAVEPRYRSILMIGGGLWLDPDIIPEANPMNFAPYIKGPKLMLHGRYDEGVALKTRAEPTFRLFSEPKRMVLYDSGHFPAMEQWVPDAKKFFDETLGPVQGQ